MKSEGMRMKKCRYCGKELNGDLSGSTRVICKSGSEEFGIDTYFYIESVEAAGRTGIVADKENGSAKNFIL